MGNNRNRGRRKALIIFVVVIIILGVSAVGTFFAIDRSGAVAHPKTLYINEGMDYPQLMDSLTAEPSTLKNPSAFRFYAKLMKFTESEIRPGRYDIKEGMTTRRVINMFKGGYQTAVNVTFNNIRVMPQLAGRLSSQLQADSLAFLDILTSSESAAKYGFTKQTFIAMFIPNSYQLFWTTSPSDFLERMNREYDTFWNEERLAKLKNTGLSKTEAATLASVVYEETKKIGEMPTVAGVYINRMRIGMPLQADPTVKFAVGDFTIKRVYNRHIESTANSPYNTYKHAGLPPGPICMPSIAAIDAVLNYEKHDYIYFCASPDFSGYHRFTKSYDEHLRNARAYAQALSAAGIR